jgi:hypothetical protein
MGYKVRDLVVAAKQITEENFNHKAMWVHAEKGDLGQIIHILRPDEDAAIPTVRFRKSGTAAIVASDEIEAFTERNPVEVIDQILGQVPKALTALRGKLEKIKDNSCYRPPEFQTPTWEELKQLLNLMLPIPPQTEWEKQIYRIVVMKEPPV